MQTPKARNSSSEVPQKKSPRGNTTEVPLKISPRAVRSREAPQKISPRAASQDVPQKISPRVARRLKTGALDSDSVSSPHGNSRTPKERRPKVTEQKSPKSLESEKKCPSRVSELESQITQLKNDLKGKISSSEACKKQAEVEAEGSKEHCTILSAELDQSPKQLLEQPSSENPTLCSELETIQKQHSVDSAALTSALIEIKELKAQLETVAESEVTKTKNAEAAQTELQNLKQNLADTLSLMEDMKKQLKDSKDSEAQAQALVTETLLQLESAKKTVETLRSDGNKVMEAYNTISSELDQSRARANLLEDVVCKLQTDASNVGETEIVEVDESKETIEAELSSLKSEVERLRADLVAAEIKYNEEKTRSTLEIRSAYELVEQIKEMSRQREDELQGDLQKFKTQIDELKANLMDKETELQGICEENENLTMKLENAKSGKGENELEKELQRSRLDIENLKANLMDKETELQNILEENEILKLETNKKESNRGKVKDEVAAELEGAKTAEREAQMKLGYMKEEVDKSNRRVARVTEQLDAAQASNAEMEAELRKLKVQSNQWRKAAEVATAMLSNGNNGKFMERTGSMDSHYSPGKISSPYFEDMDEDLMKRKNPNVLKRIGELWKKPMK
ncbi:interactor of constitutive active ROPs 3-like isoform X1 [Nicotiana sylvestris]|uniref:Interactor of constitutive active ROPs 3-like isoform X1 n=2 Tax=Nicotiana TaxID=4085 RepID=A0A1S4AZG6_TOBAC|nr:PREDICTED: interactor of constitutive active ROPs 3-like isoform X1 [Nicotiana sylvestris]XP_009780106.1 PREDICTED: interactor of constitutive active ROPs 3-like isoform X1 [Nicotiana sylvestris]XP_009780107.1 PREDICTED: interactor of constitutive active ROPs 3-like isoform X1 [Nicotiana sylvestris]XP_009780108.1 PREDICTED: interactor of constitutive active ROPs 3-like isoform X1 [Nicotiana sylvestris]XP_009780109.1 PREDICTED: interactor of constitutive active ROPs 3-like isoform X1 [Nicotia